MIFRERLSCPPSYWVIALFFGLTFVTAIGFYLGPWIAGAAGVLTLVGTVVALLAAGLELVVDATGLRVGRAHLEWPYVGEVEALDVAETRAALGQEADARAYVVDRPWLRQAVRVGVEDAADPHPHWLVATRNPKQLAAALVLGRAEAEGGRA